MSSFLSIGYRFESLSSRTICSAPTTGRFPNTPTSSLRGALLILQLDDDDDDNDGNDDASAMQGSGVHQTKSLISST